MKSADRDARIAEQPLHDILIHADCGSQDARSDKRQVGHFEQALNRSVFAERTVKDRKHDIDPQTTTAQRN